MKWDDATLEAQQTVTPAQPGEKAESPDDRLRATLKISAWTPSLTLLYFHTPHEDLEKGKLVGPALQTLQQCKTLHDEQVSKWLALYHCVEVDMGKSDPKTAERMGFKDGALFSVVDQNLNVLATSKSIPKSEGVAAFLKTTITSDACKAWWTPVQQTLDEQKKAIEDARALVKQEKFKEAMEKYAVVLNSNVRVGDFWKDAQKEAAQIQRKAEEAR